MKTKKGVVLTPVLRKTSKGETLPLLHYKYSINFSKSQIDQLIAYSFYR